MSHPLVGVVTSTTGALAPQGSAFIDGLRLGLAHAGVEDAELVIEDDAGVPSRAVAGARAVRAAGCRVVTGSISSAVALELASLAGRERFVFIAGSAVTDAISGLNRWTFRAGHQVGQSAAAAAALLDGRPATVAVLARETVSGEEAASAVTAALERSGHTVKKVLLRIDAVAADAVAGVADLELDALVVAWDGRDSADLWEGLAGAGILDGVRAIHFAGEPGSNAVPPDLQAKVEILTHYVAGSVESDAAGWLRDQGAESPTQTLHDGFVAGQMVERALAAGDDPVEMIRALEGWRFNGPKGPQTIDALDHSMLQSMFAAVADGPTGVEVGACYDPEVIARFTPAPSSTTGRSVQHVGLLVTDIRASIRFYVDALGGRLLVAPVPFDPPDAQTVFGGTANVAFEFCLIGFGATGLELFQFRGTAPPPETVAIAGGLPHFAIEVGDTAQAFARIEALGGCRFWPEMGGFGRAQTWYALDPDGNLLELIDGSVWDVAAAAHELFPEQNPAPHAASGATHP